MAPRTRLFTLVAIVALGAAGLALLAPRSPSDISALAGALGPIAPLGLVVAWIALTPLLFPGTVLAAAGGLLLGAGAGTAVSLTGALLGALAAFAVARTGGGDAALRLGGPRVRGLRERLTRRGFVSVLVLRAAPGVPATVLNYAAGLARVKPIHFGAAIALAGSPRVAAYALLGGSLTDLGSGRSLLALALWAAMSVGTPLVVLVTRARRVAA